MKISESLRNRVKGYEGYHTELPDGGCTAYLCPAGKETIGWGCTEGVHLGLVWTREQAEEALTRELAKFEAGVEQLVTVPLNQNEFDACVSLAYNIGLGAFGRSTVLKRLNKGDRKGAAKAFAMWNRGGGRVLPGLVSRRASEAALFLKPVEAPQEPFMPQSVQASREPVSAPTAGSAGAALGAISGAAAATSAIPPPPPQINEAFANAGMWKGVGESAVMFCTFAYEQPVIVGAIVITVLFLTFGVKLLPESWRAS